MKSVSTDLADHLDQDVTTLCTCWHITRRDGTEFFFTDHDRDLVIDGDTYLAATGYSRTAIENDSTMSVDNLDVTGFLDSDTITDEALRAGLFDHADARIFIVNWSDLTQGILKMRRGWLGEVSLSETGMFKTELRGMAQAFSQTVGEVYSPECRADLGDTRCRMPIQPDIVQRSFGYAAGDFIRVATNTMATGQAQFENRIYECTTPGTTDATAPTYDTTVGHTTTDGTAVFTAAEAWTRDAVVASITDRSTFTITVTETRAVDDWFTGGVLVFESGANNGHVIEIRSWIAPGSPASQLTIFLPLPFDAVIGDTLRLYPGCDKQQATCTAKFNNILNFRGEPYIPGQDQALQYPNAQ